MQRLARGGWCGGSGARGLSERVFAAAAACASPASSPRSAIAPKPVPARRSMSRRERFARRLIDITELVGGEQNLDQIGPRGLLVAGLAAVKKIGRDCCLLRGRRPAEEQSVRAGEPS